jgi:hypothetical protein
LMLAGTAMEVVRLCSRVHTASVLSAFG